MKKYLLPIAILAGLSGSAAFADEQRISVNVGDLTCPSCSFIVASSMRTVPSVEIFDFLEGRAWGEGIFVVTYDDQIANPDMIIQAVMANGYPAEVLTDDNS